jgi:hypothetical protein
MNQGLNTSEITKIPHMSQISQAPPLEIMKLYQLIDSLTKKVNHLEKTVSDLRVNPKKIPSKKHILHCLNDIEKGVTPFVSINDFIKSFAEVEMEIDTALGTNDNQGFHISSLVDTLLRNAVQYLERRYQCENNNYTNYHLPIIAFPYHKNVLYYYKKDVNKWLQMTPKEYSWFIQKIHVQIMIHFQQKWDNVETNGKENHNMELLLRLNRQKREEYQQSMNKICNVNIENHGISSKIKNVLFSIFSETDYVENYMSSLT